MFDWPGENEEEKQKREKSHAAQLARAELADDLKDNLTRKLSSLDYADDDLEILSQQKQILDSAFRRLLSDADDRYNPQLTYALAFRAQSQFRYTLDAIRDLEKDADTKE